MFLYNCLDNWRLGTRTRLWGTNGRYTTTHLHILGCNVWDTVNQISIGFTRWSRLQPQIQIKFRMGQKIVLVSLRQSGGICYWKKTSQIIFLTVIVLHVSSTISLIDLSSRPRTIVCKRKLLLIKYFRSSFWFI